MVLAWTLYIPMLSIWYMVEETSTDSIYEHFYSRLRHPNVINLMGYCANPLSFIYPYMERLSLHFSHDCKQVDIYSVYGFDCSTLLCSYIAHSKLD